MRVPSLVLGLLTLAWALPAFAQTSECSAYSGNARRVCDAAVDGTRAFHPVFGMLVSGGNPTIGSAATLGGLGHASVTVRANAVNIVLPDLGYTGSSTTVPAGEKLFLPAPLVEGSLGLYKGLPGGLLAIDFLGSAQLLPTDQIDNVTVDEDARKIGSLALGLGYGARIGILRGLGPVPDVSVSVMRRDIPTITYGDVPSGDRFSYGVDLHATNIRVVASKQVAVLDLAAGFGWDKYTGDATIQFRDPITLAVQPSIPVELSNSRLVGFVNAGVNVSKVRLTGELGYQGGKDQELSTEFEDFDTTEGKFFAGLGLRVSF
ncbi:MAG TPA: hypothetical protein VHH32_03470 [Gemmatimonadales bacterium]|nr:hypothetical protein [Gemmatimonadales bacterium]